MNLLTILNSFFSATGAGEASVTKPGVNFTNVLRAAFTRADPKSAKKTVKLSSFIVLLGSARVKAACRTLVKLTPDRGHGGRVRAKDLGSSNRPQHHQTEITGQMCCFFYSFYAVAVLVLLMLMIIMLMLLL